MSEGTVHPLAQPVGRTHAAGAFDWRAVPSADPRASAFALDTAPALPAAAVLRVQMRRMRLLAACL